MDNLEVLLGKTVVAFKRDPKQEGAVTLKFDDGSLLSISLGSSDHGENVWVELVLASPDVDGWVTQRSA